MSGWKLLSCNWSWCYLRYSESEGWQAFGGFNICCRVDSRNGRYWQSVCIWCCCRDAASISSSSTGSMGMNVRREITLWQSGMQGTTFWAAHIRMQSVEVRGMKSPTVRQSDPLTSMDCWEDFALCMGLSQKVKQFSWDFQTWFLAEVTSRENPCLSPRGKKAEIN